MGRSFYTPKEFSEIWGVHVNSVYFWIKNNMLPGTRRCKIVERFRYYIPIASAPPRLYPGPKPGRRFKAAKDMPPWDESIEDDSHGQISDEKWEEMARHSIAIQPEEESTVS